LNLTEKSSNKDPISQREKVRESGDFLVYLANAENAALIQIESFRTVLQ